MPDSPLFQRLRAAGAPLLATQAAELRNPQLAERRMLLKYAGLTVGGSLLGLPRAALAQDSGTPGAVVPPSVDYVFSILATIGAVRTVGATPAGQVRAIPITGGEVQGEGLSGRVVPGGADWQRTRADGITEIEATYAIEVSMGATGEATLIKVVNRGLIGPPTAERPAYFRTVIEFDAPTGPWTWLNEAIFVCKAGLHPDRERTVLIEVFKVA